jgi:hypothetical protein
MAWVCRHTILPKIHLQFQRLELVGDVGLDLPTHLLPRPLLDSVELLVDVHDGGWLCVSYGLRGSVSGDFVENGVFSRVLTRS